MSPVEGQLSPLGSVAATAALGAWFLALAALLGGRLFSAWRAWNRAKRAVTAALEPGYAIVSGRVELAPNARSAAPMQNRIVSSRSRSPAVRTTVTEKRSAAGEPFILHDVRGVSVLVRATNDAKLQGMRRVEGETRRHMMGQGSDTIYEETLEPGMSVFAEGRLTELPDGGLALDASPSEVMTVSATSPVGRRARAVARALVFVLGGFGGAVGAIALIWPYPAQMIERGLTATANAARFPAAFGLSLIVLFLSAMVADALTGDDDR